MSILSRITGRRYHYLVRFRYRPHRGNDSQYADNVVTIWIDDQRLINDQRMLKQTFCSIGKLPLWMGKNGTLQIEQINYLGWFKPKKVVRDEA
ncbi:hypothetical protein [Marinobacterium sp. BA1]|uniref:hypothetical protein n=1 Tax=Marinobacterium sp. BA1 TaxID=3138931 RepID=UPI0034E8B044